MVFKVIDNNLTTIFNKTQTISNGFNLASNSVNNFVDGFNRLNTQQNFGSRWDSFINGATSANGNMATYFEDLAKQGASARASIEGVYAAILDGNTRGIGNVKSVIATFNSLNPANQKAFATAVGQSNVQLGNYLMNLQTGTASMREYAGQVVATTAKTIGLQIASTALNAVISLGVTAAISGLVILISKGISALSDLTNNVEKTKEKVEKLTSEFNTAIEKANSNAKRVEELADRYDELSDGVNNLGENVSLTNEEYEEYNTLVNEIADMFPNLIQGYTDEGNAILNLKGNVEALRDAYKEAQQEAYNLLIVSGKDNDGNDILKQWNNIKQTDFWASLGDFGKADVGGQISVSQALEQLKAIQDMSLEQYKEIKALFNRDDAIGRRLQSEMSQSLPNEVAAVTGTYLEKALGLNGWTTEEEFTEAKKQAKILVQTYNAEVESALQDVKTLANAYLMTNNDYKQLDTQTQNAVSIIVNGLDDGIASGFEDKIDVGQYVSNIVDSISNNDEAQQALTNLFTMDTDNQSVGKIQSDVDKYINVIAQAIGEDSDKLKIRLGFDDIDNKLQRAKAKFVEGKFNAKPISDFLEKLTPRELDIAMQIPDLFDEGLEGATKKIREWEKNNPITLTVAFDNEEFDKKIEEATKSVSAFTSSQKDLNSALEEQKEHGQLSASTMQSLIDAGYSEALAIDKVTGAVTLNTEKYKELNNEKKKEIQLEIARLKVDLINPYKEESLAIADLERSLSSLNEEERKATQIKIANMRANLANSNLTEEQIKQKERQLADLEAMLTSLDAPEFDNSKSSTKSEEPESVTQFKKALAEKEHLLNTNQISEQEYYEWLDDESKRVYGNLADYEEDLWKYEEQVYKWRQEQEQDLFDKKIENYKKLSDNALNDKITDFGVSNEDVKNLEEFNKEMQKTWGLGNVDLTKRPKVAMDDGSTATVLSSTEFVWQGDEENGQYVAIHYTPILPDGTVLDDKSLEDYLYNTLEGSEDILKADNLGIVLKVDSNLSASEQEIKDLLNGNGISDNVQKILDDIEKWDNGLHEVQEQWVELDNKAKSSNGATTYANKWDYARSQINSAITETQNRINELSLKTGFEDEIDELTSDLEDLYDTLDDINKQEIESQKEYIQTLKDEYSDLMDEQIDQQKKLSEEIEKSYENRISAIDKQIDALNKVSEAEERQKSILEAEKDVKEAMLELDKAKTKKRLVYSGDGSWHLKEDKTAVKEAKENLAEKQQALEEAKQDEQIAKLEEQKELLETQKDNSKEYYDKVVEDLESQKAEREKQYDILVDIYEQLGGDKKQTSLNESLVEKLTSNGNINKAVQGLTPTEMKQAITSGILTTDSNGNYAIDYSVLQNNEQAVKDNTAELEKLNNQLSGKSDTVDNNTPTYNNKNLDAEGYLIGADGKRVLHDGKPIHAKNFSDEIAKRNTSKKMTDAVKGIGKFAGYDTMKGFLNAIMTGEYTIPTSTANSMMNGNINSRIGRDITKVPEYVNDNINNNNAPIINQTITIEGSADKKTIAEFKTVMDDKLVECMNYLGNSMNNAFMRQINKS